ncbi:MAG: hemolysin family protein [Alistipes sp.]|jgi:CBS domain containing-hemolysin-like protein|nr:hemolysin family protein [Alistipes sp.]
MSVAAACVIIAAMLVLYAFFSGMETAFTGSNRLKLEIDRRGSDFFSYAARLFTRHGGQYITTILVGNNIVLVIYSLAVSALLSTLMGRSSLLVETLAATVVIIFVGEYIPKSIVLKNPNFYFRALSFPVWVFYIVLWPVARGATLLSSAVIRLLGHRATDETPELYSRAELVSLVEETGEKAPGHEVKLFQNALDFTDMLVRDCMVQRINVEAIGVDDTIEELTRRFVATQYSRIFVWRDSIDNIVGYVNVKSLFRSPATIEDALKTVDYVPETMPAQELMTHLIKHRSTIAVVIDEFGGTAGVVSLEDILEEIFGEIEDEHDTPEMIEREVAKGEWVFSCGLEVDYLNEKYGLGIPESDEYDTLAGYIIFNFEDIPPQGAVIDIGQHEVKILKRTSSRIELARVRVI